MPRRLGALALGVVLTVLQGFVDAHRSVSGVSAQTPQIGASRMVLGTVVDNRNRPLVEFNPDDFVVRETGQPREMLSVRLADYPVALVLDNGVSSARDVDAIRAAAARFIGRVGHRPIAVVPADPPQVAASFDEDRAVVLERVGTVTASRVAGSLFEAIVRAAHAARENGSPFSAIVVLSGGTASAIPGELLTPILESRATVHVIASRNAPTQDGGGAEADRSTDTLRALAEQTRGQFITIYASASYQAALDRLADRMATEVLIEYLVPPGSSSGNDIQLGVRIPGARVNGLGVSSQ